MIKVPLHEGYLAFCDKKPIDANPYDVCEDLDAACEWADGWYDAQEDFERRLARRRAYKRFKGGALNYVYIICIILCAYVIGKTWGLL